MQAMVDSYDQISEVKLMELQIENLKLAKH